MFSTIFTILTTSTSTPVHKSGVNYCPFPLFGHAGFFPALPLFSGQPISGLPGVVVNELQGEV